VPPKAPPKGPKAHRRAGEQERGEDPRGNPPKSIDPTPVVPKKSPRETDPAMASQGSTLPSQPATKEPVENVVQPAETLDGMSSTEIRAGPALSSSQAPVASKDDMEIEQSAIPPDNTPLDENNHQTSPHSGQEKMGAAAKQRTALKEIWAQRVL